MIDQPLSVLKFGSSVLRSEEDISVVTLEIQRELCLGRGSRVVAVVSAFGSTTDRLIEKARLRFSDPNPTSLARLLATGETVASVSLGMGLDDCGISNVILDPHQVQLRTWGPTLDAEPKNLDVATVKHALREASVVVLGGFVGQDDLGLPTLLGRGGSDLTAVFLAYRLSAATCRLYKDVAGLYAADPHQDSTARLYRKASWEDALRVGEGLIQPKAVRFAQRHGVEIMVCAPGNGVGTKIGRGEAD